MKKKKSFNKLDRRKENPYYKQCKKDVLKRDNYCCQMCGYQKSLEIHHIKKYSEYHSLRSESFNLIVLCNKCHTKITGKEELYESMLFSIVTENQKRLKSRTNKSVGDEKRYRNFQKKRVKKNNGNGSGNGKSHNRG